MKKIMQISKEDFEKMPKEFQEKVKNTLKAYNECKITKAQAQMLDNYNNADNYGELWQVYGNYSNAKARANEQIKNEMANCGGYGYRICTYCKMFFTCAYLIDENGTTFLIYHTPTRKYKILYA